jgi:EAL domain-containing protein (putative c-di-GMP-specific phosphodiesterase class I)
VADSAEPVTAESLGWQLRSALPPMRLHSVSLCNTDADVLWLSEGALGPDEHNVVVEAIEAQRSSDKSQNYFEFGMEDGRMAIFLPIRLPRGNLAGTVMILADMKSLGEGTQERIVTPQLRAILVKIAMFMRKSMPSADATGEVPVVQVPTAAAAPANLTSTTVIEKLPAGAAQQMLGPREVEQILELEVEATPPRASAPAAAAPAGGRKVLGAGAAAAAPPAAKAALRGNAAATNFPNAKAASAQAPSKAAAALGAVLPARPEAEVLQFDANISIPTAKAAPAAPTPDIEVLAFEPDVQISTAKHAAPPADIEVLAFEPPVVSAAPPVVRPPTVSAAPIAAVPPIAKAAPANVAPPVVPVAHAAPVQTSTASTSSVRAFTSTQTNVGSTSTSIPAIKTAQAKQTPPVAAPAPVAAPPVVTPAPAVAAPVAPPTVSAAPAAASVAAAAVSAPTVSAAPAPVAPTVVAAPAAKATPAVAKAAPAPASTSSTAQTAALPVVQDDDDDDMGLIQDTGPVPILKVEEVEAPAENLPPLEALSVEESEKDLTLFAQELIKLRSSGRTRRYEVLARSQRDAHRNEVPAAFVADSARGKDGAALDMMVMERLLTWLGQHGEAIWDSEPASFSVNVSVGAVEEHGFLDRINQMLEKHNIPAEYVGFEISESTCVQNKAGVQRFVETVEKMGCFLVIDDFSMDSNVFEFLGSKALRHVKLDPKLTAAAMKEKLPQALVVAILQACKVLGVHCVAKKVDSQSSMQWLTAVGCDFAQSFSLQKPLPLESLAAGQIKALRQ